MSFAARETSRSLGEPIGLIKFIYGDGVSDVIGYTDSEDVVAFDGLEYQPVAISRDSIVVSGSLDRSAVEIRLKQSSDIVEVFDVFPPSAVVQIFIYTGHVGDNDFKVAFTGRVIGLKIETNEAAFTCEPISTSLRRSGLRRNYGFGCPLVLYGTACGADKTAATVTMVASAVDGAILALPDAWADPDRQQKYIGGMAQWTTQDGRTEVRTILKIIDTSQVLLSGEINGLSPGDSVDMILGCSHQMGDCQDLHHVIQNYGGQPWIPTKNPIGIINNFY